ncbi:hypothetical protein [Dyella sp. S184]|uniref:hypothetical protein n=1 Tax=Dyella sp. S184 TaxID=1641862 RepID=UPI00131AAA78|nr:hypothetical protein [Dyella sp. S184]
MDLVATFRKSLATELALRDLGVSMWRGGTRTSNHLLEISTAPQATVLYVKGSSNTPGFWGLTKNQLDRLSSSNSRWLCVFLHKSSSTGYLLTGGQILSRVRDGELTLSGDGDYKVNERSEFVRPQYFEGIQALVSRAL